MFPIPVNFSKHSKFPMEFKSSEIPKFRFRDHSSHEMQDGHSAVDTATSSDSSSEAGDVELESMTAKGVKHLCSELLELKKESEEDFQKNIFSNYSAFLRLFELLEGMEKEMMQLKQHLSRQKRFVREFAEAAMWILSEEIAATMIEEPVHAEPSQDCLLESHTDNVSDMLDTLLAENKLDEARAVLEMEVQTIQNTQLQGNLSLDSLTSYNSAISQRRTILAERLTMVAESARVSALELQKALVGLSRLDNKHIAVQLLLKHYSARISSGMQGFQCPKTYSHDLYVCQLAKFVFSMISQAAKSFTAVYGETSPHDSEFVRWAYKETEVFAAYFNKYVRSISEISSGLSIAVKAVQVVMAYCSLLENQNIVLRPCLIKHIQPTMEEVLRIHIDHFKKVICIFTSSDTWLVGRYLVSGIITDGSSSMVVSQQPEYCLLTNSGRKFVTLLQAISEDTSSLFSLQMEGSVLRGLMDLFTKYIAVLEIALTSDLDLTKGGDKVNLAVSLAQEVSILANLSTLLQLFSSTIRNTFKGINQLEFKIDSYIVFVQETCSCMRTHFCMQFIHRIMVHQGDNGLSTKSCISGLGETNKSHYPIPSLSYQILFLELRKLEKLAEDHVFEADWMIDLQRELMEAILVWISNNEQTWQIDGADSTDQHTNYFKQFILDIQFLVEISKHGEYISDGITKTSLDLISRMESAVIASGSCHRRDINDDEWAVSAAAEALLKLQVIEEMKFLPNEAAKNLIDEFEEDISQHFSDSVEEEDDATHSSKDAIGLVENSVIVYTSEADIDGETNSANTKGIEGTVNLEEGGHFCDRITAQSGDICVETEPENEANVGEGMIERSEKPESPNLCDIGKASEPQVAIEKQSLTSAPSNDDDDIQNPEAKHGGELQESELPVLSRTCIVEEASEQQFPGEEQSAIVAPKDIDQTREPVIIDADEADPASMEDSGLGKHGNILPELVCLDPN